MMDCLPTELLDHIYQLDPTYHVDLHNPVDKEDFCSWIVTRLGYQDDFRIMRWGWPGSVAVHRHECRHSYRYQELLPRIYLGYLWRGMG